MKLTKELKALRRRVNKARDFPKHTCGASRHVQIMADCLAEDGFYGMLSDEPQYCAETLYAVLASLWEARKELARLRAAIERNASAPRC